MLAVYDSTVIPLSLSTYAPQRQFVWYACMVSKKGNESKFVSEVNLQDRVLSYSLENQRPFSIHHANSRSNLRLFALNHRPLPCISVEKRK